MLGGMGGAGVNDVKPGLDTVGVDVAMGRKGSFMNADI